MAKTVTINSPYSKESLLKDVKAQELCSNTATLKKKKKYPTKNTISQTE